MLSDKNELTALPTASDSHAASLLPTSRKRDLGCPNQAEVATFVIQTRCGAFEKNRIMSFSLRRNLNPIFVKNRAENTIKISYLILGIITLLWTVSFIIYHFYLSSFFGFNPSYDNPTYVEFSNYIRIVELNQLISTFWTIGVFCSMFVFPIVFVINLVLKFTTEFKWNVKIILFSFISCLSIWLILYIPPFRDTFSWILD